MMRKLFVSALFSLVISGSASAQRYQYPYGVEDAVTTLAGQMPGSRTPADIRAALYFGDGTNTSKLLFFAVGYNKFLQEVQSARLDKQAGATPSSQGTTSVVSKGVAAQVLSLATEAGALTRTDSKTTSTFQVNFLGTARLLTGAEQFPYCAIYDYSCESASSRALRGASAGVSFYTAPGNGTASSTASSTSNNAAVLNPSARTVAGWNVRYDFHVRRDMRDMAANYRSKWASSYTAGNANANAFAVAVQKLQRFLLGTQTYKDWEDKYVLALQAPTATGSANINRILSEALQELVNDLKRADPTFQSDAEDVLSKMSTYFGNRDAVLSDYVNKVTFSLEYDNDRPGNQPTQSTAKFIVSARPTGFQFTANASIQWYDQTLHSNVSRIRDAQVALQFDRKFGSSSTAISPTLSAGYYFQYMVDNALLTLSSTQLAPGTTIPLPGNASELLNTKGSIHLGQVKVTFAIRNTGINFPIALTFSNRTDLIKASNVRGNFGITYDLDSLFTKK